MATNTGEGYRKGSVKNRTQLYNPQTDTFIKRDAETGRFMDGKRRAFQGRSQRERRAPLLSDRMGAERPFHHLKGRHSCSLASCLQHHSPYLLTSPVGGGELSPKPSFIHV